MSTSNSIDAALGRAEPEIKQFVAELRQEQFQTQQEIAALKAEILRLQKQNAKLKAQLVSKDAELQIANEIIAQRGRMDSATREELEAFVEFINQRSQH
ncbi:MAG: hypothetical protein ACKV2Q_36795 [Planctomycetaceae bacterium]